MQIGTKVSFHNRFDIEVRDSDTGKLKQKGSAENIVLDRMYTRLCNFNDYFTQIVFGSGTGDLSPGRTTLFSREGSRKAATEETIKGFPVSKWTRRIRLEPEEFVGVEFTEVGISEHSTNINTHALIKDAEGNQLSIMKTDTDIVIIYATIFIELRDNGENIYWCNLPNNNGILNYLLGEGTPSSNVSLGRKWTRGDTLDSNIIGSKKGSYTPDIGNKKVKLNTLRFGTVEGNGPIAEIEVFNAFKTTLPDAAVFQDYNFRDINIGVGDGNTREFTLPHIRANNIIVKTNNSVNTDVNIKSDMNIKSYTHAGFKVQDLTGVGNDGRGATISQDGETIITASNIAPYFTVHKLTTNGQYEKVQNLTGAGDAGRGVAVSQDGKTIVTTSNSSPYFTVHKLTENGQHEKAQDLIGVGSIGTGVAVSQDGETIVTTSESSPYFTVHKLNVDGQYEKVQNLTGVGSNGRKAAISQDGETIVTTSNATPNFTVHSRKKVLKTIVFDAPPTEGTVIAADYSVPYIPKSEDYVLDVSAEVQFGEGAIV